MKSSIRFIALSDASKVLNIYKYYIENTVISFETEVPTIEEFTERIKKIINFYPWLVFEEMGEIRGYAYATSHRQRAAYRWSVDVAIYLDATVQGKGIGKQLYTHLLELLKLQGFFNAYGGISLPNEKSIALHEKFGFKKIAEYNKVGYKNEKWWNVGWWELALNKSRENPKEPVSIKRLKNE